MVLILMGLPGRVTTGVGPVETVLGGKGLVGSFLSGNGEFGFLLSDGGLPLVFVFSVG